MSSAPQPLRFVVLTGLSGAGKTTARQALEDLGYFAADNLPPRLWLPLWQSVGRTGRSLVVGVDVRTHPYLADLAGALTTLQTHGVTPEVVFLDAQDDVLLGRYNLTRRTHPLGLTSLLSDIAQERRVLSDVREHADVVLDTSGWSAKALGEALRERFAGERVFMVRLVSFGFKWGVPIDADNVFDLRAMPNPYYDPQLRPLDGRDARVAQAAFAKGGERFYGSLQTFVQTLSEGAVSSGRNAYTIALGCTGGQHRSVAVGERLKGELTGVAVQLEHRDVNRNPHPTEIPQDNRTQGETP